MISNRDKNPNLAREVLKKKKQMEAEANKEKKKMMIAYIVIGAIAFLLIVGAVMNFSNEDTAKTSDFETPELSEREKYNSKIEALEAKNKKVTNKSLLDVFSQEEKDTTENVSSEEEALRKNLEALESDKPKPVKKATRSSKKDVYGDYTMWEDENNKKETKTSGSTYSNNKELTYEEKLRLAKEARFGTNTATKTNTPKQIETRVAIFRDQFLLPGELAELVLTEDFTYNNKLFKKGTPVYGYININKSRVLFDIKNIAHQPLDIEVRDIRDGLIGMYSSRAGELWKKYETEGVNDATDDVSENITNNRILSNSIDAISSFFKKKRLNNNDKIMLLNDQQLIVYIN